MNKDEEDKVEIEVSSTSVKLKGAYSDFRPAIKRSVAVADQLLELLQNIVGLPADFLNHHLVTFREQYKKRIGEIPDERREIPPFRIGTTVLKEVALAAEEPEFQRMFAELLASASDSESAESVHPGYASIINQLTAIDAKIVRLVAGDINDEYFHASSVYNISHELGLEDREVRVGIDNLVRVGLLEWRIEGVNTHDLWRFRSDVSSHIGRASRSNDLDRVLNGIAKSVTSMSNSMEKLLQNVGDKAQVKATLYGKRFVKTCLTPADESDNGE